MRSPISIIALRQWHCVFIAVCISGILLLSCGNREKRVCVPFVDLEKRPSFSAIVDILDTVKMPDTNLVLADSVIIGLQTKSGEKLCIGDPVSNADLLVGFARTLKKGNTYEFPKQWLAYKAQVGK